MDVAKLANLANLPITPAEALVLQPQLDKILDYVSQLQKLPLPQDLVAVSSNVNVTRPDETQPGLPAQSQFVVPGILDTE